MLKMPLNFQFKKNYNGILSRHIYPHIASEMRVFVFALKISLSHINMSLFSLFIRFYVVIYVVHVKPPYYLKLAIKKKFIHDHQLVNQGD
jgi:hypothetical protein